jgi:hypothetical protein
MATHHQLRLSAQQSSDAGRHARARAVHVLRGALGEARQRRCERVADARRRERCILCVRHYAVSELR